MLPNAFNSIKTINWCNESIDCGLFPNFWKKNILATKMIMVVISKTDDTYHLRFSVIYMDGKTLTHHTILLILQSAQCLITSVSIGLMYHIAVSI